MNWILSNFNELTAAVRSARIRYNLAVSTYDRAIIAVDDAKTEIEAASKALNVAKHDLTEAAQKT